MIAASVTLSIDSSMYDRAVDVVSNSTPLRPGRIASMILDPRLTSSAFASGNFSMTSRSPPVVHDGVADQRLMSLHAGDVAEAEPFAPSTRTRARSAGVTSGEMCWTGRR